MHATMLKRVRSIVRVTVAALCVLAVAGLQSARAQDPTTTGNRGQLSASDYKFVTGAAQGNAKEVTLGQLAEQKAADPSVRSFGQHMTQDHQRLNQELMQLVSQKGATLPSETGGKDQGTVEHLKSLSGADFDKAYMKQMVKDHKSDVKEFQHESTKADDPNLKTFASQSLPVLKDHLHMAETIQSSLHSEPTSKTGY